MVSLMLFRSHGYNRSQQRALQFRLNSTQHSSGFMLTLSTFLALASIHLAVVMTPGANFLVVTHNSLTYSRRTGLLTVRGVATGSLLLVTAGFIGFAAVISQSPLIYNVIRIVGALYFVYTGYNLIIRKPRLQAEIEKAAASGEARHDLTARQAFRSGLMTAMSNPAAMLYFLSLFTTVIPTTAQLYEKALMALLIISITFSWYTLVAMTFSIERVRAMYARAERWINIPVGLLWFGLALKLLAG
jgi:RhtB (resistance to homoserine/threonine) family protein